MFLILTFSNFVFFLSFFFSFEDFKLRQKQTIERKKAKQNKTKQKNEKQKPKNEKGNKGILSNYFSGNKGFMIRLLGSRVIYFKNRMNRR